MSSLLLEFRSWASREFGKGSRKGRRYSAELRALAIRYVLEQRNAGRRLESASSDLGVSAMTLRRWLAETEPSFRRVTVAESASKEQYAVVTPDGFRVEGVAIEDLASVLDRLR